MPAASITLTPEEEAKIKQGKYTAALAWHTPSDYTAAVDRGAQDEFARLGIEVVAVTDAGFDAAKQKSDVETIMAKKPTIILSLPVDPDTAAEVYRPALEAGIKVAFVDNAPKGFVQGKDYVTIVSDDLYQMGEKAADAMAAAIGGKGKVGYLFHDANFYVTNQRDGAFKETIGTKYKDIEIVAEMGLADPAKAEDVINAFMIKNPDLDAVYVTWAEPAEFVLAALRNGGNTHTKIVTLDLSEPLALDMVKDGNVAAIVADEAYAIGADPGPRRRGVAGRQEARAVLRGRRHRRDQGQRQGRLVPVAPPRPAGVAHRRLSHGGEAGDAQGGRSEPIHRLCRLRPDPGRVLDRPPRRRLPHHPQSPQHRPADDAGHDHGGRHGVRAHRRRDRPVDRLDRRRLGAPLGDGASREFLVPRRGGRPSRRRGDRRDQRPARRLSCGCRRSW